MTERTGEPVGFITATDEDPNADFTADPPHLPEPEYADPEDFEEGDSQDVPGL